MQEINLMDLNGVYSIQRNVSVPSNPLYSWFELPSSLFIPLQEPASPTHHTTLTLPTGTQT